ERSVNFLEVRNFPEVFPGLAPFHQGQPYRARATATLQPATPAPLNGATPSSRSRLYKRALPPPQLRAAFDSFEVGDKGDVSVEVNGDSFRIATADEKVVIIEDGLENREDFREAFVPFVRAEIFHRIVADELIVRLPSGKRVLPQFEMRHEGAVYK